ncbi:hypothetical protein V6760_13025, partial [Acinetobacter venetianus]
IKQGAITHSPFAIEKEADRPDLALLQGFLNSDNSSGVPCWPAVHDRIVLCYTHVVSPSAMIGRQEDRRAMQANGK